MTPSFNGISFTQILEIFPREESQLILANRSMIYNSLFTTIVLEYMFITYYSYSIYIVNT